MTKPKRRRRRDTLAAAQKRCQRLERKVRDLEQRWTDHRNGPCREVTAAIDSHIEQHRRLIDDWNDKPTFGVDDVRPGVFTDDRGRTWRFPLGADDAPIRGDGTPAFDNDKVQRRLAAVEKLSGVVDSGTTRAATLIRIGLEMLES